MLWCEQRRHADALLIGVEGQRMSVDFHHEAVVDGVLGWKLDRIGDQLRIGCGVMEGIDAGEVYDVGAVPLESLLAVRQGQSYVDAAGIERESDGAAMRMQPGSLMSIDLAFDSYLPDFYIGC